MTKQQWLKKLHKKLSPLPNGERRRAEEYYTEIFDDKRDAGISEEEILREFGSPAAAADKIIAEYGDGTAEGEKERRHATAGDTAARLFAAFFLFLFVILPIAAVIVCLAAAGAALFISGFAVVLGGFIYFAYFLVQLCMFGGGAYIAHLGIGLAAAGIGALLVPLFLYLTKWLFIGCGKIFVWLGKFIRGKREAH